MGLAQATEARSLLQAWDNAAAEILFRKRSPDPLLQPYSLELPLGYAPPETSPPPSIAVILHAFHLELLDEFRLHLGNIPFPADLFISTDTEVKRARIEQEFAAWHTGRVEVRVFPNRGRDVAPKLVGFSVVHRRYEYVLHLHTKLSSHESRLAGWRGYILGSLLGSPEIVRSIFETFRSAPWLGMLAPQHIDMLRPWIGWGANFEAGRALAERIGLVISDDDPIDFPSGSMFWARSASLLPLIDLDLGFDDFPEEAAQTDGTLAHAIERLYFHVCEKADYGWMKIATRGALHDEHGVTAITGQDALKLFLARRRIRLADPARNRKDHPVDPPSQFAYPSPRRLPRIDWARALGTGCAIQKAGRLAIIVAEAGPAGEALARCARQAVKRLPRDLEGDVISATPLADRSPRDDPAAWNGALRHAFAAGAHAAILVAAPGYLHAGSIAALVEMHEASCGRALLEAAQFPATSIDALADGSFRVNRIGNPVMAFARDAFEACDGFDENLTGAHARVDLSWRAAAMGHPLLRCPRALFIDLRPGPAGNDEAANGYRLAVKWGSAAAQAHFARLLKDTGLELPEDACPAVPAEWRHLADFSLELEEGNA
ncbi:rhamnan synthesis F family protein [Falsiroseomonas sp. E2-1-a20]|uniref:rhamnan synthesis F family protein n=1 Tax=Falsiroseomonas sp. E2-1-a20 TaxID=3239300 RepID=UPI003F3A88C6